MDTSPVDDLAQSLTATEQLLSAVEESQWSSSTPCSDWSVRQLVNHVVGGNRVFAEILSGQEMPPMSELRANQGRDVLGDDPLAAYRDSAAALVAAFRRPGVLDELITVPIGTVPGHAALQLRIVESLVHGWDLAAATGQELSVPDEVVEQALVFSRARLGDLPPGRSPFAPAQPAPDDAPAIERLVALLGRSPGPEVAG